MTLVPATSAGLSAPVAVANLAPGLAGQFIGGTVPAYAYPPGAELAYVEFTADVTITAVTPGTAQDVVSSGAVTYDGTAVIIEFFCPSAEIVLAGNLIGYLQDGATELGALGIIKEAATGPGLGNAFLTRRKLTPSAGSHTYKVTGYKSSTTAVFHANSGGSGNYLPGYIRVTKA